jgi:PKD repeat protein
MAASLLAAGSLGIAAWSAAPVAADQSAACQARVTGPVGGQPGVAGGVNLHIASTRSVTWCSAAAIGANYDIANGTNFPIDGANSPVSDVISVHHLLQLGGVAPEQVTDVQIHRLDGTLLTLNKQDLEDPSPSYIDHLVPVVQINGTTTLFLRPQQNANDLNAGDQIPAQNGAALDFYVYSGPVLTITANGPTSATKHQRVTFRGQISGATPADGTLHYAWTFDDGSRPRTGLSTTHAFTTSGNYQVVLTVTGRNGSGGVSPALTVDVGSAPKPSGPGTTSRGTSERHSSSPTGPQNSHGRTPGGSSGGASPTNSNQATHTSTTTTTQRTSTRPAHTRPPAKPKKRNRSTPPTTTATTLVDGRLISYITPVPASQLINPPTHTTPAHAPPSAAPRRTNPIAVVGGVCAIILLLGAGAGTELRSRRRSLPRPAGG